MEFYLSSGIYEKIYCFSWISTPFQNASFTHKIKRIYEFVISSTKDRIWTYPS